MKKVFLFLTVAVFLGAGISVQAQCPTEYDSGICDSLILDLYDVASQSGSSYPAFALVELLVSHDIVTAPIDSLRGFIVPLAYTSSNAAAFCSIGSYWNNTGLISVIPDAERSIFHHLPTMANPEIHNRMMDMNADFMSGWDFIVLDLGDEISRFFLNLTPTGTADKGWWEGNRVLLATMTFLVDDSMTICIDTTFWPPSSVLGYWNYDGLAYFPKLDMPSCFYVSLSDVRELPGSDENRPSGFSLSQNYPNPFNPVTNIAFTVPRTAHVRLDVYNVVGQKVKTLVDQEMKPGSYAADWDGTDQSGKAVSSGIYFYRMEAGDFAGMKKMLLLK
jgi:hypothetical protein